MILNRLFLYRTKASLIEHQSARYLYRLIEVTEIWHENEDYFNCLFCGDADSYFFIQSLKSKTYLIHDKESFNDIIYKTQSDYEFFEKMLRLAVEDNFYIQSQIKSNNISFK